MQSVLIEESMWFKMFYPDNFECGTKEKIGCLMMNIANPIICIYPRSIMLYHKIYVPIFI